MYSAIQQVAVEITSRLYNGVTVFQVSDRHGVKAVNSPREHSISIDSRVSKRDWKLN